MFAAKDEIYVLDGSQCQQLEHGVGKLDDHPMWTSKYLVEGPEHVKTMHKQYLRAGSDIIETLTFQISIEQLQKSYGLTITDAQGIIEFSVELARTAWKEFFKESKGSVKNDIVAGSVGPYGALLHDGSEYTGAYIGSLSTTDLINWHRPRVQSLVNAGVDFLCFETLPSLQEALALLDLLREFPNQKAWISFTCKDNQRTAYGENFGEVAAECYKRNNGQILAIGCNCTNAAFMSDLLQAAHETTKGQIPLVVYPNSGEIFDKSAGWTGSRLDLGAFVPKWIDLGAKYIGGCCRTDANDIRRIREVVDGLYLHRH